MLLGNIGGKKRRPQKFGRILGIPPSGWFYRELFARARLVLNYAERGDLNFRVFEALACRACLLTPWVRHGLDDLFDNGRHLFVYDPNDMDGLAKLVQGLLDNPARRERVAEAGWRLVLDHEPGAPCLHLHHADVVGDDVMELSGDAGAGIVDQGAKAVGSAAAGHAAQNGIAARLQRHVQVRQQARILP